MTAKLIASFAIVHLLLGCAISDAPQSPHSAQAEPDVGLSYGLVKRHIAIGRSTQEDVIRLFGSPNNMVYKSDRSEMWIYDRFSADSFSQTKAMSGGFGAMGASETGGMAGSSATSKSSTRSRSSVRTLTVIIDFDTDGVVSDINARQGGY
jgi:hypothetical protein